MNVFKEIRERANILDVCESLGVKLNRNYKALCPFHNEKTPSFSISPSKNIFCCFGCDKKGDSITLVSELLKISPLESAKYINETLHLGLDFNSPTPKYEVNRYKEKRKVEDAFKKWELETFILITDYLNFLYEWKKIKDIENKLYIEALQNIEYTKYIVDLFLNGTDKDKIWFWKNEKDYINKIKNRISTLKI